MMRERLTAQPLAGPRARDAGAVTERRLAVQPQDARGARLAVRARTAGLAAADVDRALTDERSLVVTWLNRGTLHRVRKRGLPVAARADAAALHRERAAAGPGERAVSTCCASGQAQFIVRRARDGESA